MRSLGRIFAVVLLQVLTFTSLAVAQSSDFTIVVFSDIQNETQYFPQVLNTQAQWVVNNRTALNIQAVLGLGDNVNDGANNAQWATADAAFKLFDQAAIPYFVAIGNHDYNGANAGSKTRTATGFNQWFGPARYAAYPWYVGNFNGSNENYYGELTINGKTYLVLVLEYVPRDIAVAWAAPILAANLNKEVWLVTHSFIFSDNTRVDQCDTGDLNYDNYGDKLWAKLVSQSPNFTMATSGHITAGSGARRADLGVKGNLVNQMFSNYQGYPNGGDGYFRILTFHPATDTIDVKTYSAFLNTYLSDPSNQFTINWHAHAVTATTGTVSGLARDVNTCKPVAGVRITSGATSTMTDVNGHYSMTFPAGSVTMNANSNGYYPATNTALVNNGYTADTNFFMTPPCPLNTVSPSVTLCAPANGATLISPVAVTAAAIGPNPVVSMKLYVDGIGNVGQNGSLFGSNVAFTPGPHRVTMQAKDSLGNLFKQTVNISVCNVNTVSPSVTICTPQTNTTVASPVNVLATSTNTRPITWMQLYVDGLKVTQVAGSQMNTSATLKSGTHRLTVQSVDNLGGTAKQTIYVTVP